MPRNWIEFDDGPIKAVEGESYASMNKEGEILVNAHAYDEMGCPEAIVLLFEPDTDTIGLKPASRLTPNAFNLTPKGRSGHRRIWATAFAKRNDIRLDATVRFRTPAVEDGIFVLSLRNIQRIKRTSAKQRQGADGGRR